MNSKSFAAATVCDEEIARIKKKARPKNVNGLNETAEVRLTSKLFKATPHDPCASVCAASTGVEAQIFVRLPKFDAGLRAKCASLCATSRRIDVIFDDVGNHDG